MENNLVPIDIAVKLKDIGFDLPCLFIYRNGDVFLEGTASVGFSLDPDNTDFLATLDQLEGTVNQEGADWVTVPTYDQVFQWFREKGVEIYVGWDIEGYYKYVIAVGDGSDYYFDSNVDVEYGNYEDARLNCLEELIESYEELEEILSKK